MTTSIGSPTGIQVDGKHFALHGKNVSYLFHVDESGELITDHFGGTCLESTPEPVPRNSGWVKELGRVKREYPDLGRGDFRTPAIRVQHADGSSITRLLYKSHKVTEGKSKLEGLSSTYGDGKDVSTLSVQLEDDLCGLQVELLYSIFPEHDVIVKSAKITNGGKEEVTVERAASLSVDMPYGELEMIGLRGDHQKEATRVRKKVDYGIQSFASAQGYSSHHANPYVALVSPGATETHGEAWAFNLVYTGSHSIDVEKGTDGHTRVSLGMNPYHLSYPLAPGESLTTPECVATYSASGLGATSRQLHRLYRHHLMRGPTAIKDRPVLLNSWEGLYFDFDEARILKMAKESADLGVKLFVLDDGWFGDKYPRINDGAGLGDWIPNPKRFPNGLPKFVDQVTDLKVNNGSGNTKIRFGLWVEPEMVNPESELYHTHADWCLHSGEYPRTENRNQLVLDLSKSEVQDYIIDSFSKILSEAKISYIKWDNNRAIQELPHPSIAHKYIIGLYRVLDTLTTRFPDVLWEGCASGGGRFDAGLLPYFPVSWTSDNTDAWDRIFIQFGTSLAYPAASMGCHVSAVPSHQTRRVTTLEFRAHVAMMGGSFGFELDPSKFTEEEQVKIPEYIATAEKVNPLVVRGDQYRLAVPDESNFPAVMYLSEDGSQGVLFAYHMKDVQNQARPPVRLQGLEPKSKYKIDGQVYHGATLMNAGLYFNMTGDCQSKVLFFERV